MAIGEYQWLLIVIILMIIGGYFINGYSIVGHWWLFYRWLLVTILLMAIGGILLVVIIL